MRAVHFTNIVYNQQSSMLPNSLLNNSESLVVVDLWQIFDCCKDEDILAVRTIPYRDCGKQIDLNKGDAAHFCSIDSAELRVGSNTNQN